MDGTDVSEQRDLPVAGMPVPTPEAVQGAMPSLMEQYLNDPSHDYKTLKYGDVMDGIIMRIDRDELLVDIGSKSEGIVPAKEFSSLSGEEKQALGIGEIVLVFVVQPENQEGHAVVSIDRARQEKSWRKLQEIFEANEVIEAEVTNYNKGGLLVNLDGVRGFVPASQVSEIRGGDDASKQADMARLIGSSLPLKVIEINRHRNRLILSERQAIQERRDVMKERLIEELKEGEVRKGRVSSICDFGAFVDIGGADGLVHLSELSWSRVRHPSEVLRIGQEIDVYVLGINAQEKKIALSIKRTQAEPWSRVAAKYEVGQLVRGSVTQLANFGAFARIEDGIEGLIHVSELTDERITHPKQVVREGQELILRIIRIDPQRRRMGLSLRRALDTPDAELEAVLGEGATEERDRIVQTIRAALEAEGIEIGSGRSRGDGEGGSRGADETGEDGETRQAAEAGGDATETPTPREVPGAPAPDGIAVGANTVETATPVVETVGGGGGRTRAPRPSVEIPSDIDGEPLSAIGMAFAIAGADFDLVNGGDADVSETVTPAAPTEATQAGAESNDTPPADAAPAAAGEADEGVSSDGEEREG
ncbi:MAG: small subunit ribosomal protein [Thermomicrobiales bacterium]|jgi:small subunit ribosomal protein S1|nr:small subunit ribosomal protein [Thermomicrobiales bacterium]